MKKHCLSEALEIISLKPGVSVSMGTLKQILPDVETALFFAMVYKLDVVQLRRMLVTLFNTNQTVREFLEGNHSVDLQDYLVETVPDMVAEGVVRFDNAPPPQGAILPEMWDSIEIKVASSIVEVADKLAATLDRLPGKEGRMVFQHMQVLNRNRPTIGDYRAAIDHPVVNDNLVIFDVSGSMTEPTVKAIAEDVVALGYKANAHLVIVSNTARHWEPGSYSVDTILSEAEYMGTHYEMLVPLFTDQDWDAVVTIADYDSSLDAKHALARCNGRIGQLFDVSLVNRSTFLAECLAPLADEVRPLLIGSTQYPL